MSHHIVHGPQRSFDVNRCFQISDEPNDADSTFSEDISTTSLTSSILEYRTLHGRTFHREIGQAEAWEPNDERHAESMDLQ